jgi:peptidoglycan/LPS O-acetylase OafA/YrhL
LSDSGARTEVSVRFADSSASVLLDLFRAAAATAVALSHWRNIFFVDYGQLGVHKSWFLLPYLAAGGGHESVIVFFVLSGFFVGGAIFRAMDGGVWDWRDYLLKRFVRLWIVLAPALLLCAMWDRLGMHLGYAPGLYHGGGSTHMLADVQAASTLRTFLANLFFLQNIAAPTFGSDSPLWSLANEFWYYLLFPLGLFAVRKRTKPGVRVVCGVLFVGCAALVGKGILGSFPIWLMGVALLRVPPPRMEVRAAARMRMIAFVVYVFVFAAATKVRSIPALAVDYLLGVATMVFLWVLLSARGSAGESVAVKGAREAARFSYSLYALHVPLLVFCASLMVGESRRFPGPVHVLLGLRGLESPVSSDPRVNRDGQFRDAGGC